MSDYTQIVDFSAKDALPTGNAAKLVLGADFDGEFAAIQTAITSKYDSNDIASSAQSAAETLDTVLITPLQLANWSDANAGMVGDLQALTDPGADRLFGWDDSAGVGIAFSAGTGMGFSGTTFELSHLGIEDLTDPGADRIPFWDETTNAVVWGTLGSGIDTSGTSIFADPTTIAHDSLNGFVGNEHIDHSTVSITAGNGLSGGGTIAATRTVNLDISGLSAVQGNALVAADGFLVDNGGTMERMAYSDAGVAITSETGTTDTIATADMNTFIEYTNAASIAVTLDTGVGVAGNFFIVRQGGAGQVTVSGTATFNSAIGESTRTQDSVVVFFCRAADTWAVYGDAA